MLENTLVEEKTKNDFFDINQLIENKDFLKNILDDKGVLLIKNVEHDDEALKIAKNLGSIHHCVDANTNGITVISNIEQGKNINNSLAFTHAALYPHTDRSPIRVPPKYLINWCVHSSNSGGEVLLCDGHTIFSYLMEHSPLTCKALMESDAGEFSDTVDTYIGPIFKLDNGKIFLRFRRDNCVKFKTLFHNHIHTLYEAIDLYTFKVNTKPGEGYVIDNTRWLHGRTAFEGNRVIKRIQVYE
jgi:alpha-ketoglutarate-dependent taurine dioxygenase